MNIYGGIRQGDDRRAAQLDMTADCSGQAVHYGDQRQPRVSMFWYGVMMTVVMVGRGSIL